MPISYQYLTDRTLAPSSAITTATLIHIVNPNDTTQNPDGSSYKANLSQLLNVFAGSGDTYWTSGSTGTFSIRAKNTSGLDATGNYAVASGFQTKASGFFSFAEGYQTSATTIGSHSEGYQSLASGYASHSEGTSTASGNYSHSEGYLTISSALGSHSEGSGSTASGNYSHAEGTSIASGIGSHAEGGIDKFGNSSPSSATTNSAHAEGFSNLASGLASHAEGNGTRATGQYSHSEGSNTTASGQYSHSEGKDTIASGDSSHAEGNTTTASGGGGAHAEGTNSVASGVTSHAEGFQTTAGGGASHSQNYITFANGVASHAGGSGSTASGDASFIHSTNSLVTGSRSVVLGGQNITGTTNDMVYVPYFNIRNLYSGTSINNLGIDSSGNVVSAATATFTGNTSATCITDIFVTNVNSCSPLHIQPLNNGNVYISESGGNVGIGTTSPVQKLHISGNTLISGALTANTISATTYQNLPTGYYNTTGITTSQSITWDNTYWGISGLTNVDITLPSTTSKDGYYLLIKDEAGTSGTYRIRLTPSSGLIDGNSYVDMNINYMSLTVMVRNGNWYII